MKNIGCEPHKLQVNKDLLHSYRMSRQQYTSFLEALKKEKKVKEAQEKKKKILSEVKETERKDQRLEAVASYLIDKADKLGEEAKKTHKWVVQNEANALHAKGKQKRMDVEEAKKAVESVKIDWLFGA